MPEPSLVKTHNAEVAMVVLLPVLLLILGLSVCVYR